MSERITIPCEANDLKNLPIMLPIEIAKQIPRCSGRYMRTLCESGQVRAVKVGRMWRVNRDSLLSYCGLA